MAQKVSDPTEETAKIRARDFFKPLCESVSYSTKETSKVTDATKEKKKISTATKKTTKISYTTKKIGA